MPQFERYIGVDYSGAQTAESSLKGLRVYAAEPATEPYEVLPQVHGPVSQRKYWSRRGIAEWITEAVSTAPTPLVGIDHRFSFPLEYFDTHNLPHDWDSFLDDFQRHWPTDEENIYVDFVRDGLRGNGAFRCGKATWRRITERRCRAKSVFHFDVQGSVAKSTRSGIPGFASFDPALPGRSTFGLSTAGRFFMGSRRLSRFIPPCGADRFILKTEIRINTMPTRSLLGSAMLTEMARSRDFWLRI